MTGEEIAVCPECDTHRIIHTGSDVRGTNTHTYQCRICGHEFDDPRVRARMSSKTPRRGLARKLAAADPSDIGGDHEQ